MICSVYPEGIPPQVCLKFEEIAVFLRGCGYASFSADAILHRIRWEQEIERGHHGFKCNNNWTSELARWFIARNPAAKGFFALREKKGEL